MMIWMIVLMKDCDILCFVRDKVAMDVILIATSGTGQAKATII